MEEHNIFKSYIVFSERCELKNINISLPDVKVIKRNFLLKTIKEEINNSTILFSKEKINQLYIKLQKFTYVDDRIKDEHIRKIQEFK